MPAEHRRHGARHLGGGRTRFSVWAPRAAQVVLEIEQGARHALAPAGDGYHDLLVDAAPPGTRYRYRLDGDGPFPDPASRWQPEGVHGPSAVAPTLAPATAARTGFRGLPLGEQVICELHVGTFTGAGTFAAAAGALAHLAGAGYTAVELMPVAEFPGDRNWGYDGVFPFAAQSTYGGPQGLAAFVDAAHALGLAVVLDVVYNHLGPEGAVHDRFGPYFSDAYRTPWGAAPNLSGAGSAEVRAHFLENALFWTCEVGVDGLRLDAVHAIVDPTASPFVAEMAAAVRLEGRRLGRTLTVVAESADNDPRLVRAAEAGGLGLDGQWDDDFHHSLRVALTGERDRWLADYSGAGDLAKVLTEGFAQDGRWSPARGRRHGASGRGLPGDRLVVFAQNHDQIGNLGLGTRLAATLPLAAQWPIAAAVLLSPFVPLRFMGEEYGDPAPFPYFTSHEDPDLASAVRRGRAAEVGGEGPDPQDPATFAAARPDRSLAAGGPHAELLAWQRRLLAQRAEQPALAALDPALVQAEADEAQGVLVVLRRPHPALRAPAVALVLGLAGRPARLAPPLLAGCGHRVLASRHVPGLADGAAVAAGATLELGPWAVLVLLAESPS